MARRLCTIVVQLISALPEIEHLEGDEHRRDEKCDGAEDPHDNRAKNLIFKRRLLKGIWMIDIEAVDGPAAEREERRQKGVYDVRRDQKKQDAPSSFVGGSRPWAQEAPPEKYRGTEETEVLHDMPALMLQGITVGCGNVPSQERNVHRQPGDYWCNQPMSEAPKPAHADQRCDKVASEHLRYAA